MAKTQNYGSISNYMSNRFTQPEPVAQPAMTLPENYSSIGGGTRPVITEDVEIKGELAFSGELEFNGRFEGTLESDGSLLVGEKAIIKGNVGAESAVISGKIQGDVKATGRIHLRAEAMIYGDIRAYAIVIEEGASVDGKVVTTQTEKAAPDFSTIFTRLTNKPKGKSSSHTSSSTSND